MRAAVVTALTGPDAVEVQEVDEPRTAEHQVFVDIEYAGVVFPDVLQTRGEYQLRPEPPLRPGLGGLGRRSVGCARFPIR
jgi:NADPH:quinone reductase